MIIFCSDAFAEHYTGGAELTTEAIIKNSLFPVNKVLSKQVTLELMEKNKNCLWLFGNFSGLDKRCILYAAKNLDYCVVEYDYKFCKFRSIKKHEKFEGECNCHNENHGKLISAFMARSRMNFGCQKSNVSFIQAFFHLSRITLF